MSLFYKIFKPVNPILWDGNKTYESTLKKKYFIFFDELMSANRNVKKLLIKLLTLFKESIVFLLTIIYFPFSIILYFFNYRFLHINTAQIGAYIEQIDTIIKQNLLNKNNKKIIFLCPKFILVNNFIHKIYGKHLICLENFFLYLFLYPFVHTKFLSLNFWNFETINPESEFNQIQMDYYKKFKNYVLELSEIKNEKDILSNLCKEKNINIKNLIVVQQRDQFYYNSPTTRNASIDNFTKTINYLIDNGYDVIRYKSKESKSLNIYKPNYHELIILSEDDKIKQFLIFKNCRLVICYQGGISTYSEILNTQFLLTNAIPINRNILIKPNDRVILKKYFSKKLNKFLNINMLIKEDLHLYIDVRTLSDKEVILHENNEEEILCATKETLAITDYNHTSDLQKMFREIFPDKVTFKYSPSLVCNTFLKKNSYLVNQ